MDMDDLRAIRATVVVARVASIFPLIAMAAISGYSYGAGDRK